MTRILSALLLIAGCMNAPDVRDRGQGRAVAQIAIVPAQVACVRVTVFGQTATAQRPFSVTPGQSSILSMAALPTGQVNFLGEAFNIACGSVNTSSVASWTSDLTPAVLVPGSTTNIGLTLRRSGNANVDVEFVDDGGAAVDGGVSPSPQPSVDLGAAPNDLGRAPSDLMPPVG
jgi:hypothetical protein